MIFQSNATKVQVTIHLILPNLRLRLRLPIVLVLDLNFIRIFFLNIEPLLKTRFNVFTAPRKPHHQLKLQKVNAKLAISNLLITGIDEVP